MNQFANVANQSNENKTPKKEKPKKIIPIHLHSLLRDGDYLNEKSI